MTTEFPPTPPVSPMQGRDKEERSRPTVERHLRRLAAWLGLASAILALAGAVAAALTGPASQWWSRDPTTPVATILSPAGVAVPHIVDLFGTMTDLPPGSQIWAANRDMTTNRIYPQDHPCVVDEHSQFNCGRFWIGSDDGAPATLTIVVMIVDADATNTFAQYQIEKQGPASKSNNGLAELPAGAKVIGSKLVVRN